MIEAAGVLLALILAGAAWSAWRVVRAAARLVRGWPRLATVPAAAVRAHRLHVTRAVVQSQSVRLDAATAELLRVRAQLRLAERECDRLRQQAAGGDRFAQAKRAFALRFHPDRVRVRGLEGNLRRMMFQEYWTVLQRIERS